jgi:two-component system response regulator HydG
MHKLLIIDDDTYICKLLDNYLSKNGFSVDSAYTSNSAKKKIDQYNYDLIVSDYRLPDNDGKELLGYIKSKDPSIPVIIMTAYKEVSTAVSLIKSGAYDYITKPLIPEELSELIKEAIQKKHKEDKPLSFEEEFIIGNSRGFREILEHVKIVAPVDMTVIIEGETGSGKEYIARSIHHNSHRKKKPFVAVDCGALPKGLVNSELFGHIKGSFTGAIFDKQGLFEQANEGTLFLDEISNLDAENQMKLLRVLQEKTVTRIGDSRPTKVDVRLVIALNQDLLKEVELNNIRDDLYHRLNEFKIKIPPLRDRKEDIMVFADAFLNRASIRFGKEISGFKDEVIEIFNTYSWPGNIRELKNVVNRSVLLSKSNEISKYDLPEEIITQHVLLKNKISTGTNNGTSLELKDASSMAEKDAIIKALIQSDRNKTKAARLLKIDRKTLYNKIKQFNIRIEET